MATKISSIYDALVTKAGTLLPSHFRIPNPYAVEANNIQFLDKGWGIQVVSGVNTERHISCYLGVLRTINLVLTRRYFALDFDAAAKAVTEKDLLEDQFLFIEDLEREPTLGGLVAKLKYASDSGVQSIFVEGLPFYMIISSFELEYFEDLNL